MAADTALARSRDAGPKRKSAAAVRSSVMVSASFTLFHFPQRLIGPGEKPKEYKITHCEGFPHIGNAASEPVAFCSGMNCVTDPYGRNADSKTKDARPKQTGDQLLLPFPITVSLGVVGVGNGKCSGPPACSLNIRYFLLAHHGWPTVAARHLVISMSVSSWSGLPSRFRRPNPPL